MIFNLQREKWYWLATLDRDDCSLLFLKHLHTNLSSWKNFSTAVSSDTWVWPGARWCCHLWHHNRNSWDVSKPSSAINIERERGRSNYAFLDTRGASSVTPICLGPANDAITVCRPYQFVWHATLNTERIINQKNWMRLKVQIFLKFQTLFY